MSFSLWSLGRILEAQTLFLKLMQNLGKGRRPQFVVLCFASAEQVRKVTRQAVHLGTIWNLAESFFEPFQSQ